MKNHGGSPGVLHVSRVSRLLRMAWLALAVFLATLAGVLLVFNLSLGDDQLDRRIDRLYGTSSPQFERTMGGLLGPGIVGGNKVEALLNGDQVFPAMLDAIGQAQHSITFETFIYWSGDIGKAFAAALANRAQNGVKVHLLLDWVGSAKMEDPLLETMRSAGVQVVKFHEPHRYNLARLNNRTHRKLLVVDGRVGFTGGVGIAREWTGSAQDPTHWRDSHFKVQGPVVAQMQSTFLDNWLKETGEVLHGEHYYPPLQAVGSSKAHMFSSSPSGGSESMHLMYHMAITAAERSIDLSMAYFVPDELSTKALQDALRRGVRVRLITPGPVVDTQIVRRASRAKWGPLLQAGLEIYEYQPTMYHCKVMIIDTLMVSVGSTNFDNRSFRLNDEANLNIYDAAFATRQLQVFEDDLNQSKRVSLQTWANRPLREKALERLTLLLESQI